MSIIINPYRFAGGGGGSDPFFANVVAGLHFDGANGSSTFTDIKGSTWTRADSGTEIDTAQSKFGGASLINTRYIETPDASFANFGSGDFTIDFWLRFNVLTGFQSCYSRGYVGAGGMVVQTGSGDGKFNVYIGGSVICTEASAASAGVWYYYEINRAGSTVRIFRDGTQTASGTSSANINAAAPTEFMGASGGGGINNINGWGDDFRITNGVARNTAGYTPPSSAFPNS